jgi:DNA-binding transcriptional LysR family regulator
MRGIDWSDLRFFLAVAEQGSLGGAARELGVNHTTVLRRINALEQRLGLRLFDRLPSGYAMTVGGEVLLSAAKQVENTISSLERALAGQDLRLVGSLRVTTTDTLAASLMMPIISAFRTAHPGIDLELAISNAMFSLSKRDADVAVRPATHPPENLVGRRIGAVAWAVYASIATADRLGKNEDLFSEQWVAGDDNLSGAAAAKWLKERVQSERIAFRADSFLTLRDASAAGLGLAVLPCYLGDLCPALRRIGSPLSELRTELWILTHPDLRRTARVRAFMEFAANALSAQKELIEGIQPLQAPPVPAVAGASRRMARAVKSRAGGEKK